jgi:HAD superfamily hydrolase (TIGR01509 family)
MLRGVIVDYGSTLITFAGDVAEVRGRAHRALLAELQGEGLALRPRRFLPRLARKFDEYDRKRAGDNLEPTSLAVLAAVLQEEKIPPQPDVLLRRALQAMYEVYEVHWQLFPDAIPALEKIRARGMRLAMLSNAADEANVRRMLAGHRLTAYFDPLVISAEIGVRKPDARAFQPILAAWAIPAGDIVMIGDQLGADILGAQQLGLRTIWLRTEENAPANRSLLGKVAADAQVRTFGDAAALVEHWIGEER